MAHPRFSKLPVERQEAILSAATQAFAEHGFEAASYNRIIEAAGISKGSAYYYFEGKEDLYVTVLERALAACTARLGRWVPPADPASFWRQLRRSYFTLLEVVMGDQRTGRLLRGLSEARRNPKLQQASLRFEAPLAQWLGRVLAEGRRLGAVRRDLPEELLLAAVLGAGQATDFWLLEQWDQRGPGSLKRAGEQAFTLLKGLVAAR